MLLLKEPIEIPLSQLAIAFIPAFAVLCVMWAWRSKAGTGGYAVLRMLSQLLIVGYALDFIFKTTSSLVVLGVLIVMVSIASWISLRTVPDRRMHLVVWAFLSILLAGGSVLALISAGVLRLDPWYSPRELIPLAGMIFSNCMNAVSLSAERFFAERDRGVLVDEAKRTSFQAAMIPITNALFAVGLVSIPGMMTGQVLAGVDPKIAARYQIMVMCMVYGSAGLSSAAFLWALSKTDQIQDVARDETSPYASPSPD